MSNTPNYQTSHSLELLARLRALTADFARREEALGKDLRTRRSQAHKRQVDASKQGQWTLEKRLAEIEANAATAREAVEAFHAARRTRIEHAKGAGLDHAIERKKMAQGKLKASLQMRDMKAKKNLPLELKAADTALAEFNEKLSTQRAQFAAIESGALNTFGGYPALQRHIRLARLAVQEQKPAGDHFELFAEMQSQLAVAEHQLGEANSFGLPKLFRYLPLPAALALIVIAAGGLAFALRENAAMIGAATLGGVVLFVGALVVYFKGQNQLKAYAAPIASALSGAGGLHDACREKAKQRHADDQERAQREHDETLAQIKIEWARSGEAGTDFEQEMRSKIIQQAPILLTKNDAMMKPKLAAIEADRARKTMEWETWALGVNKAADQLYQTESGDLDAEEKKRWEELTADWHRQISAVLDEVHALAADHRARFAEWSPAFPESWTKPDDYPASVPFGRMDLDLAAAPNVLPKDARLTVPGGNTVPIPLALAFPEQGSLLLETKEQATADVVATLNNLVLRLLTATPPGKISISILDPVGLGQNFAGLMHLTDYEDGIIGRRIWTQPDQIAERLNLLAEHIEKVIQMYLRNEYATISEYNAQAGSVAEKYHFLVVADFPNGFSEAAVKNLQSIAASGARCGIFTLIHWDQRQQLPDGISAEDLRRGAVSMKREKDGTWIVGPQQAESKASVVLETPPDDDTVVALTHKIGKASVDSNRVQVPFSQIAPPLEQMWTEETTHELKVAVGRTGATKLQYLAIGKGTRQHALIAGKTGSGKSTLFHVAITNLALWCSPDQVEFYLIDFKKGVEFKCYATQKLPHARVIAIESDREFGLSVLQRVDEELKRRGDLFRKLEVQDVAGYKKNGGTEPMPRTLLMIDEFQEFFVVDDSVAQQAAMLFDRIVRQGRAFGIHVILGSQTLGGAYSLARATLGQMVIRVALQCNEADAALIMDEGNSAPRLLSRPGEGIYNDAAGASEGNSPFQVVWIGDDVRDAYLAKIRELTAQRGLHPAPAIVFEGNAPAAPAENALLADALARRPAAAPGTARCWLGAPNSIKGPTEASFRRQSGNNMLIVGQRDDAALTLVGMSLLSLAAQFPVGTLKLHVFHAHPSDSPETQFLTRIAAAIPHGVTISQPNEMPAAMNTIAEDRKARAAGDAPADAPTVFLFVIGMHKFKKLRHEDDYGFGGGDEAASDPGAQINELIADGSVHGIHLVATFDTFNNVSRYISRKAMSEFEMRVVFQMSANDSASLIETPKAADLGLHRALFYNEQEGVLETFRPYATPEPDWIEAVATRLATHPKN